MTNKKPNFLIPTLVLIILIAIGYIAFLKFSPSAKIINTITVKVLKKVGQYEITDLDVSYKDQINSLLYPTNKTSYGLMQLTNAFTTAQILINNKFEINDTLLIKEEERIDKTTKNPEMLAKIKDIFKSDHKSYLKVFILPTLAERTIYYEFFLHNPKIHENSFKKADSVLQKIISNSTTMESYAKENKLNIAEFTVSKEKGVDYKMPDIPGMPKQDQMKQPPQQNIKDPKIARELEKQQKDCADAETKNWMENIAPKLKDGQIFNQVIDRSESWFIVKLVTEDPKKVYNFKGLSLPKEDYQTWLNYERAKVKVE